MIKLFRSFARRTREKSEFNWKQSPLDYIIKDKNFLSSIGIKNFPVDPSFNTQSTVDLLDSEGGLIGSRTFESAKELAKTQCLDLILLSNDPPLLKLDNFKTLVLKKIRIAHTKNIRKDLKEDYRTVSIRNSIKLQDFSLKMLKIEDFIKTNSKILIEIPFENSTEFDRAKILAKDTWKYISKKFPDGDCRLEEKESTMAVFYSPNEKIKKLIKEICESKQLFEKEKMKSEYKKIKKTLEKYRFRKADREEEEVEEEDQEDQDN